MDVFFLYSKKRIWDFLKQFWELSEANLGID